MEKRPASRPYFLVTSSASSGWSTAKRGEKEGVVVVGSVCVVVYICVCVHVMEMAYVSVCFDYFVG